MRCSAASRVLTLALAMRDNARGLATLAVAGVRAVRRLAVVDGRVVVRSGHVDPASFALTVCVVAVTAALMLLPKSQQELMRWFSIAALALLAICYLGILLAPQSVGPSGDRSAGARPCRQLARRRSATRTWRPAIMAMLLFLGIYVIRCRRAGYPVLAIIALRFAVPAVFGRQKLADAVLCGAAADVADVSHPLVLAARRSCC